MLGKYSANLASPLALSQINSASLLELYREYVKDNSQLPWYLQTIPEYVVQNAGSGKHYSDEIGLESLLPCAILFGCCWNIS